MKRIVFTIFVLTLVMLFAVVPVNAHAEEYSDEQTELNEEVDNILSDYDIGYGMGDISGLTFGELAARVKDSMAERLAAPIKMLGTLLVVTVFTALLRSTAEGFFSQNSLSGIYNMICVMTAVTVITPQLFTVYERALSTIEIVSGFLLVFVPVFAGIAVVSGGFTTGGIYNVMTLAASEAIVGVSQQFLIPVVSITTVLAVSGSVFPNASLDSIGRLMKKGITWSMTVIMTLFTGFVTLKCSIAGKMDGVTTKAAKYVISGFIPIVGGAVSDAYATVRSSFDVICCTAGAAGVIAIILLMLPPILEILVFRGVLWIGTAAAEVLSADPIAKLMKGIDSGLAIAQSVLICYLLMFVLCTAILMQSIS